MNKTKRFIILNLILSLVLIGVIGSLVYGWYIKQQRTASVNVSTDGIVLSYFINDDEEENKEDFTIENLTFFDSDNENEGKYWSTMAICMEINITNKSKSAVNITLSNGNEASDTDPYVACAVSSGTLDSTAATSSVDAFLSDNSVSDTMTVESVEAETGETKFYVYVYGVQPDDSASNSFLYIETDGTRTYKSYDFSLLISAVTVAA